MHANIIGNKEIDRKRLTVRAPNDISRSSITPLKSRPALQLRTAAAQAATGRSTARTSNTGPGGTSQQPLHICITHRSARCCRLFAECGSQLVQCSAAYFSKRGSHQHYGQLAVQQRRGTTCRCERPNFTRERLLSLLFSRQRPVQNGSRHGRHRSYSASQDVFQTL